MDGPQPTVDSLLSCYPGKHSKAVIAQFVHRLALCKAWGIEEGAQRLIDIGCGQGECSMVLASVLGPSGRVTGTDVAPLDYGAPITLGQCQEHILASQLGSRIRFERAEAEAVLAPPANGNGTNASSAPFDGAVICHSLWYFDSAQDIRKLFSLLAKSGVPRIYLAEWKGEASSVEQEPHSLAARAQAYLHSQKPPKRPLAVFEPNVRAAFSTADILHMAEAEGWRTARKGAIATPTDMMDGHWEAQYVKSDGFKKAVEAENLSAEAQEKLAMYIDMVKHNTEVVESSTFKRVGNMDVTWAVLEKRV
ncbi:SAM-dependent methyltransferase [Purpureocillium lavendulum]|uniref:SAM-dependent methyltransferase n=1 Tax=Purpureocillium lavendulum TaxID=1247861 RepID=A0AB34FVK3_9HYPO|nr:SAM-dependent methyltransferase [Purpureocillium lavendulum]